MAFIPVPNVAQVELIFSQGGQIVENVYHVLDPDGWDVGSLNLLCEDFLTWWQAQPRANTCQGVSLYLIKAKDLTSDGAAAVEYTTSLPVAGSGAVACLTNSVTLAIKWNTGLAGRSYRGRTYHIGLYASMLATPNTMNPATVTELIDQYSALLTSFTDENQELVVVSRIHDGAPRVTGIATPIVSVSINPTIDNQRRRLPERGL